MICRIFNRFCVVCIRNEWISWLRGQKRIADREINMAFVLGESNEEIARTMGRCRSTISVQKKSGLEKLWKYMENDE